MYSYSKKRFFSFSLIFTLLFSLLSINSFAGGLNEIKNHWAGKSITKFVSLGFVKGYSDGSFRPDNHITRAEFAVLINKVFKAEKVLNTDEEKKLQFIDVKKNHWFYKDVTISGELAYIKGYSDNTFKPLKPITRQEASAVLYQAIQKNNIDIVSDTSPLGFKDSKHIAAWSYEAVSTLVHNHIIKGYPNNTFRGNNSITRAETVVLLDKIYSMIEDIPGNPGDTDENSTSTPSPTQILSQPSHTPLQTPALTSTTTPTTQSSSNGTTSNIPASTDNGIQFGEVNYRPDIGLITVASSVYNCSQGQIVQYSVRSTEGYYSTVDIAKKEFIVDDIYTGGNGKTAFDYDISFEKVDGINDYILKVTVKGKEYIKQFRVDSAFNEYREHSEYAGLDYYNIYAWCQEDKTLADGRHLIKLSWKSVYDSTTTYGIVKQTQNGSSIIAYDLEGTTYEDYHVYPGETYIYKVYIESGGGFEYSNGVKVVFNPDSDGDELSDEQEQKHGSDMYKADSDGDGISDSFEVLYLMTNPLEADSDGDGLTDGDEVNLVETDPNLYDTDGDGLSDGYETNTSKTDPLIVDTDEDSLSDGYEINVLKSNPLVPNIESQDNDEDGLTNIDEEFYGTDPNLTDTDNDGLSDTDEVKTYFSDPNNPDTDGDGLNDGCEVDLEFDPNHVDTNKNGIIDNKEMVTASIPKQKIELLDTAENLAIPDLRITGEAGVLGDILLEDASDRHVFIDNRALVGKPIDITTASSFEKAEVRFKIKDTYTATEKLEDLVICWWDEENGEMVPLETTIDANTNTLIAEVNHFSIYSVFNKKYFQVDKTAKSAQGEADIVFVIDTTGSMSSAISNVRNNVITFADNLNRDNIMVNLGLVQYRDITSDGLDSTKVMKNGLTNWYSNSDLDVFKRSVGLLSADGGGDAPETAIDGLEEARNLGFRKGVSKHIILVTDVDYKVANRFGIKDMAEEIEKLKSDGIFISVITGNSYEGVYRQLYTQTKGMFANISGSFAVELNKLKEHIAKNVNDGTWIYLSDLTSAIKLDKDPLLGDTSIDTDKDGIPDLEELNTYVESKNYWTYYSNPASADTDNDGINDKDDLRPKSSDIFKNIKVEPVSGSAGNLFKISASTYRNNLAPIVKFYFPDNIREVTNYEAVMASSDLQSNFKMDYVSFDTTTKLYTYEKTIRITLPGLGEKDYKRCLQIAGKDSVKKTYYKSDMVYVRVDNGGLKLQNLDNGKELSEIRLKTSLSDKIYENKKLELVVVSPSGAVVEAKRFSINTYYIQESITSLDISKYYQGYSIEARLYEGDYEKIRVVSNRISITVPRKIAELKITPASSGKTFNSPFDIKISCDGTMPEMKYTLTYATGSATTGYPYTTKEQTYKDRIIINQSINGSVTLTITQTSSPVKEKPVVTYKLSIRSGSPSDLYPEQLSGDTTYADVLKGAQKWSRAQVDGCVLKDKSTFSRYGVKNLILEVTKENGYEMDPYLVAAIISTESGGNPEDRSGGYWGLMQTPKANTNMTNYKEQIRLGINIYKQKIKSIKAANDVLATVSYNSGEGIVLGVKGYTSPIAKEQRATATFANVFPAIPDFVRAVGWNFNDKVAEIRTYYPRVFYCYQYLKAANYLGDVSGYENSMLSSSSSTTPVPTPIPTPIEPPPAAEKITFPIKYGYKADNIKPNIIKDTQLLLNKYCYDTNLDLEADSHYGRRSTALVKLFQKLNTGYTVTGEVTKEMYDDLIGGKLKVSAPDKDKMYMFVDDLTNGANAYYKLVDKPKAEGPFIYEGTGDIKTFRFTLDKTLLPQVVKNKINNSKVRYFIGITITNEAYRLGRLEVIDLNNNKVIYGPITVRCQGNSGVNWDTTNGYTPTGYYFAQDNQYGSQGYDSGTYYLKYAMDGNAKKIMKYYIDTDGKEKVKAKPTRDEILIHGNSNKSLYPVRSYLESKILLNTYGCVRMYDEHYNTNLKMSKEDKDLFKKLDEGNYDYMKELYNLLDGNSAVICIVENYQTFKTADYHTFRKIEAF